MPNFFLPVFFVLVVVLEKSGGVRHKDPDLWGDYCRGRRPVTCCPGRDDSCSVPILGTLCYCDLFCNRTSNDDCCPDFWEYCMGVDPPFEEHTRAHCLYGNKKYYVDEYFHLNCNKCTCKQTLHGKFEMECENKVCLIRPEVINDVNRGYYGWTASNYSIFWGKALAEGLQFRLGTSKPSDDTLNMNKVIIDPQTVPDSFDARTAWPGYIQRITDQGDCAASWAFSTTSVASDRLAIQTKGREKLHLSPQHLISCQKRTQNGCQGGHIDRAWWYLRKNGVVDEECYPYTSKSTGISGKCLIPKPHGIPRQTVCIDGKETMAYQSVPPYRVGPNEKEIMHEIMVNGPVQATFEVRDDFFMYKSGVYQHRRSGDGLPSGWHSVRIIGWGVDYTHGRAVKYWLCANSWGILWGEHGYFKIVRGENESNIEMFIVGVWAKHKRSNHYRRNTIFSGHHNGHKKKNGKRNDESLNMIHQQL